MSDVDASELNRFAVDLSAAGNRISAENRKVIQRGAFNILRDMRTLFSGHRYAPSVPASLEVKFTGSNAYVAQAEVGELDSAGPQWGIAALLAFGSSKNAPVLDHTAPLRSEAPKVMEHLVDAAEDLLQ